MSCQKNSSLLYSKRCLTSQWNGRLRAAHSGAVHRRVRRQRLVVRTRGVLRMELKRVESAQSRAGVPREFSRPHAWSLAEGSALPWLGPVLVSERARPEPKARAGARSGVAALPTDVSIKVCPRGFSRQSSPSVRARPATELSGSAAVRARAATGSGKSLRSTPTPNQPIERTLSRYALQRRSSPC